MKYLLAICFVFITCTIYAQTKVDIAQKDLEDKICGCIAKHTSITYEREKNKEITRRCIDEVLIFFSKTTAGEPLKEVLENKDKKQLFIDNVEQHIDQNCTALKEVLSVKEKEEEKSFTKEELEFAKSEFIANVCSCSKMRTNQSFSAAKNKEIIRTCLNEVSLIFPYSITGAPLKSIFDDKDKEQNFLSYVKDELVKNCEAIQNVLNQKEVEIKAPKTNTAENLFIPKSLMVKNNLSIANTDGQMKRWVANKNSKNNIEVVFDIRYQFANEQEAMDYYQNKLNYLSEGAPETTNTIKALGLSQSNVYDGDNGMAKALGLETKMRNYIFRIKNVIAKVFISANGKASEAQIFAFAQEAIKTIKAAQK